MIKKVNTPIGDWDIEYAPFIDKVKPEDDDTGICIPNKMLLKVRKDIPLDMKKQTLIHEINHAIESQCGLDLKEPIIDSFATHWLYIIRNNPKLMRYLQNV